MLAGLMAVFYVLGVGPSWMMPRVPLFPIAAMEVAPKDPVFRALHEGGSLDRIQQAVLKTGKHPDELAWGTTLLNQAVLSDRRDVVAWLLSEGASSNGIPGQWPPLACAAAKGDLLTVRLLLRNGADPHATTRRLEEDVTAADVAQQIGHAELVAELRRAMETPARVAP